MAHGGNAAARDYFKQHGILEANNRYHTTAAEMYKKHLDRLVAGIAAKEWHKMNSDEMSSPKGASPTTAITNDFVRSETSESPTSPVPQVKVVALSSTSTTVGAKKVGGKVAKKAGLGGGKATKVEGPIEEATSVPTSLLYEEKAPAPKATASSTNNASNSASTPTSTTPTSVEPPSAKGRFYGLGSDSNATQSANTLKPTYDPAKYAQRSGPDYGGIGSANDNDDGGSSGGGFSETMWQIGDSLRSLKEKATAKRDSMGEKVKTFLDDL